jgi:hypothetical protein
MRTSADIHYVISDERLRAYARVPLIERLRWLDELVRFTQLWRAAPVVETATDVGPTRVP